MTLVDAQVHLWQRVAPGGKPQRPEPFGAAELLGLMDQCGVSRALLAPTSWSDDGEDGNDVVLQAVTEHPDRFRAIGVLSLTDARSPQRLAAWRSRGLSGFCLRFHHPHLAPLMTDGSADWVWPAAERAGVPLTLNVPHHLPLVADIARRHPRLRIAVDHLGLTTGSSNTGQQVDALVRLAELPNVVIKADGLTGHSHRPYPFDDLYPDICRVLEAFGSRRFFWGSDLTRTWQPGCSMRSNYEQAIGFFDQLTCLPGSDRELVMGQALCDWIDWR